MKSLPRILNLSRVLTLTAFTLLSLILIFVVAQFLRYSVLFDSLSLVVQGKLFLLLCSSAAEVLIPVSMFAVVTFLCRQEWRAGHILTLQSFGHSPVVIFKGIFWASSLLAIICYFCAHTLGPRALHRTKALLEDGTILSGLSRLPGAFGTEHGMHYVDRSTGALMGVEYAGNELLFVSADASQASFTQTEGQINLANLAVTGASFTLLVKEAQISIQPSAIGLAPKVLRGAKLKVSPQLELKELDDSFAYWRRWALVMSLWGFALLGLTLPAYLGDFSLVLVVGLSVAAIHVFWRSVELYCSSAWGVPLLLFGSVLILYVTGGLMFYRTFWRI